MWRPGAGIRWWANYRSATASSKDEAERQVKAFEDRYLTAAA
jgi:hypothetical protein